MSHFLNEKQNLGPPYRMRDTAVVSYTQHHTGSKSNHWPALLLLPGRLAASTWLEARELGAAEAVPERTGGSRILVSPVQGGLVSSSWWRFCSWGDGVFFLSHVAQATVTAFQICWDMGYSCCVFSYGTSEKMIVRALWLHIAKWDQTHCKREIVSNRE